MVRQRLIRGTNQGCWQLCGQSVEKRDEEVPVVPQPPANRATLLHMAVNSCGVSLPLSQPGGRYVEAE